ncbi:hypothetical protein B0H21DRAFT_537970 [Amylocystis lapponica]|nr:hypothetical protein B0H21DRAFT_537970 [Amylocystis lapponica]
MSHGPNVQARDGSGGSTLSTSTIVIIAVVCGSVVILVFILFLWRLLVRSCRRKEPVPLPPVQPLAHHREQAAAYADLKSRPSTFFDSATLHTRGHIRGHSRPSLYHASSNASLITDSLALSSSPLSGSVTEDGISTEGGSIGFTSPLSADSLPPPNPSFNMGHTPGNSTTSVATFVDSREGVTPSPSAPFSETESSASHVTSMSGHRLVRPNASPARVARSHSRQLSRPISRASSVATSYTGHSHGSVVRGAPHLPHNNIQIVLPAPLAPQTYPYIMQSDSMGSSRSSYALGGDDMSRRSVVDQWIPVGTRSLSMGPVGRSASSGPTFVDTRPRTIPRTPSGLSQSVTAPLPTHRRSQSQPRSSASSIRSTHSSSASVGTYTLRPLPPPVPRIPAEYGNVAYPIPQFDEHMRGRQNVAPLPGPMAHQPPFAQHQRVPSSERGRSRAAMPIAMSASQAQTEKSLPPVEPGHANREVSWYSITEPLPASRHAIPQHELAQIPSGTSGTGRGPVQEAYSAPPVPPEKPPNGSAPARSRSNTLRKQRSGPSS